jgi:hypothetical protein
LPAVPITRTGLGELFTAGATMAFPHGDVSDASLHLNAVQLEWDEAKRTANVAQTWN